MKRVWLLNGPNLNLLGERQPHWYGSKSLRQIEEDLKHLSQDFDVELECKQTNSESEMIKWLHQAKEAHVGFILINAAAWTHTSIALRDALLAINIPFIEIHLSNVYARETFRHDSYLADIAKGIIVGLGPMGYELGFRAANQFLNQPVEIE